MSDRDEVIDANSEAMRSCWVQDAQGSRFIAPVDGVYRFGSIAITATWPANGSAPVEIQWDSESSWE